MADGGYGFHRVRMNILKCIRKLDVESVRSRAGLKTFPEKA